MHVILGIEPKAGWRYEQSLQQWLTDGRLDMSIETVAVVGQKGLVEASGSATQRMADRIATGRIPKMVQAERLILERYCGSLIISKETRKVVELREHLNTALVQEVMEVNK